MTPGFLQQDQWQAQIQAQVQLKADVYVYADSLSDAQIRESLLLPCRSIEATIAELRSRYGAEASICVLPGRSADDPLCSRSVCSRINTMHYHSEALIKDLSAKAQSYRIHVLKIGQRGADRPYRRRFFRLPKS